MNKAKEMAKRLFWAQKGPIWSRFRLKEAKIDSNQQTIITELSVVMRNNYSQNSSKNNEHRQKYGKKGKFGPRCAQTEECNFLTQKKKIWPKMSQNFS